MAAILVIKEDGLVSQSDYFGRSVVFLVMSCHPITVYMGDEDDYDDYDDYDYLFPC